MKALAWFVAAVGLAAVCASPAWAQGGPSGLKVWSADIHDVADKDTGGPAAVHIVAARNGWHSGKVVVGASGGVQATVGDLKQSAGGTGVIPAAAIQVRYGMALDGNRAGANEAKGLDVLAEDSPPATTPSAATTAPASAPRVPVWLTVKVPKDAKPGAYSGELKIAAGGASAVVPVKVDVADWTVPDPADHATWLELMQSPDTLALEYGVEPWSPRHWDLIGRSLRFLGEAGAQVLYIPLIERTNAGNEESMVRWVVKGAGKYEHDFTHVEKYLDLAAANGIKPRIVIFNVWDRYLTRPGAGGRDFQTKTGLRVAAAGPRVTMLDAAGKVQHVLLPDYPSRESITVAIDVIRGERPSVDDYLKTRVEELKKTLADFQEQQKGQTTIDGQEARWVSFSCSMGPFRVQSVVYLVLLPKGAVSITCLSRPEKFEKCKSIFEKAAASVKLQEKDLTLAAPEGWTKADFQYRESGVGFGVVAIAWGPEDPPTAPDPVRDAWKKLFDGLRERMKARGLEKTMLIGMASDFWATKDQTEFMLEVTGKLPWANASHYFRKPLWDIAEIGYHTFYFGARFGYKQSLKGWARPEIALTFDRSAFLDAWPMARWRHMAETSVTGNTRGVGRLGGDTWNVLRNRQGARSGRVYQRYPESDWGYLNIRCSLLAPGPQGALATVRYEVLREGIQDCEARIQIEKALADDGAKAKLGADLGKRCEEALAERTTCLWEAVAKEGVGDREAWRARVPSPQGNAWFLTSGWQERAAKLYALAGEVQAKLGAR